ncbi:MAG TPA: hypothetical protein VE954_21150 [Oligoflexus sp.]|uniref:carboxylate--amine ligase n=1 Tax=Oligoflexus sp. TaxID=1971216 RepID=UPI002D71DB46|nr:hypothetical protein [Oligoflexus sp.]HYX35612.1 hypothetical protein [Oligoflexus sp.]
MTNINWSKGTSLACQGVLLTLGDYYGTLAAARYFGKLGIPVYLAEWRRFVPSALSKYVTKVIRCPNVSDWQAFSDWLLDFGQRQPGLFLYPTSDDTAWIYASRKKNLSQYYYMLQPGSETIYSLLNKVKLHELCEKAGLKAPKTHLVHSEFDLQKVAEGLEYPVLIKPRTQIGSITRAKGHICQTKAELLEAYPKFMKKNSYVPEIKAIDPFIEWPMIQSFHKDAMGNTLSIAGVTLESGEIFLVRGSKKVIQRPRKLGIGLCFQGCDIPPEIAEACRLFCKEAKYFGAFELEMIYVEETETYLLIDFNPRYYSQMAFEIARDLPIPGLVYMAAAGKSAELNQLVTTAKAWKSHSKDIYSIKWLFYLFLSTALMGRNISWKEYTGWLKWLYEDQTHYVDAVMDRSDRRPFFGDVLTQMFHYVRHPFSTYRRFFRDN